MLGFELKRPNIRSSNFVISTKVTFVSCEFLIKILYNYFHPNRGYDIILSIIS